MTLAQFDTVYEPIYSSMIVGEVPPLKLVPRGGTALNDSLGKTIKDAGTRFSAMPESQRPGKVIVFIITDGEENSSHEYSGQKIKEMIQHQRDKYKWEFIFICATEDALQRAEAIGIHRHDTMRYSNTGASNVAAYAAVSGKMGTLRATGVNKPFTDEERIQSME